MYSTDTIADMLTRIRNALLANHSQVTVPYSRVKESIARIFVEYKFVAKMTVSGQATKKVIQLQLVDPELMVSPISALSRVSKPGRRVYVKCQDIPYVKSGRGLVVLSTSQGLMSGFQARRKRLGGEVICSIY